MLWNATNPPIVEWQPGEDSPSCTGCPSWSHVSVLTRPPTRVVAATPIRCRHAHSAARCRVACEPMVRWGGWDLTVLQCAPAIRYNKILASTASEVTFHTKSSANITANDALARTHFVEHRRTWWRSTTRRGRSRAAWHTCTAWTSCTAT